VSVCLSVRPFIRLSVTSKCSTKMAKPRITQTTPSSFLALTVVDGRRSIPPEICTQSDPPPFRTQRFRPVSTHSASTVRAREKSSISTNRKCRPRAFQRAIDEPCTLPLSPPKGGTKTRYRCFASKIQLLSKEVCYKVSLCENFQRQSCRYIIPLSNGP